MSIDLVASPRQLGLCLLVCFATLLGTSHSAPAREAAAQVPTPAMPDGWQVVDDYLANSVELSSFSSQIGATLLGVRNTGFSVQGGRVQVNTLIVATAADGDRVMAFMRGLKPDEFLLRRGNTIYEFVCTDAMIPAATEGRQHLERAP